MKPFDLEAAKRGEPIVTRDGAHVKLVAHVPEAQNGERVVVLIGKEISCFHESGDLFEGRQSKSDLFMAPKKKTVWVNFYSSGVAAYDESEQDANDNAGSGRIGGKAYPVEIDDE